MRFSSVNVHNFTALYPSPISVLPRLIQPNYVVDQSIQSHYFTQRYAWCALLSTGTHQGPTPGTQTVYWSFVMVDQHTVPRGYLPEEIRRSYCSTRKALCKLEYKKEGAYC